VEPDRRTRRRRKSSSPSSKKSGKSLRNLFGSLGWLLLAIGIGVPLLAGLLFLLHRV
jgi:hypothetical protein